jgi:ATP-dependent helicase/nuclease subunit B
MQDPARRIVESRCNARLITAANEFISSHAETVVVAPTHSAGEELTHRLAGAAGAHRMTFVQLAADLARQSMSQLGLAPLSALGLEALAARVVYAARAAHELKYFEPVSKLPGFARALARTLAELRLAGIRPDSLAASGEPGEDLARLLARYEDDLEHRALADLARVLELAAQAAAEGGHRWTGLPLVSLDVPLDSQAHRNLFARVAKGSPAVLAAVSSGAEILAKMFDVTPENLDAGTSGSKSTLEHLRKYVFSPTPPAMEVQDSGLELFSAPSEGLETVEIARRILRLAHQGIAFDQVAILLRSPERYQPMIEDALRRAKIPAYFSRGSARPDPGGRAFLALLACAAEKCSASRFAEYLSLGQVPGLDASRAPGWVAAEDELLSPAEGVNPADSAVTDPVTSGEDEAPAPRAPLIWEKLLVDAAVIGGRDRWQRRLHGLEREFELRLKTVERDDEARRSHLERQLDQLRQFESFALPLIDAMDALPAAAHWREWLDRLTSVARLALRRPEPVLTVLAEFEPMSEVGPASLEEVAEVLGDRLRFLRRDPPQRRYGRVFVASIEEARGREFAVVFLPGLAEGLFPQRALEDPLLLDDYRRELGQTLLLRDGRVEQERLRLRLALAAARDRLIASYPHMDVAESRPRVPSFYALELPRAAQGSLPELKKFEQLAREAAPARLNWPAPPDAADAIDDAEYDLVMLGRALAEGSSGRYVLEVNPHVARSLRARWARWEPKWREADGLITKDPAALAALAEHRLSARAWSPSSLQQFAICPYKFTLHGIHGLRPREEPAPLEQMDPLTRGGLFHAVQFALLGELRKQELLPVNAERLPEVLRIADRWLDHIAAQYEEDLVPAIPGVWKSEIEDLRTDLRGWLQHIAVHDDDWEPIHFEFAFGLSPAEGHDPASTAEVADLRECGVRLRGSIDLVERNILRSGVLRITDHKTGKPPESIPAYVGGGRFLQPLLYSLAAEQLLGATVEGGRLFYATQQGGYQQVAIQTSETARRFLAKLLASVDLAIAEGFLPPAPQKDACGICDYRPVCGPYEELRVARHKDRRDERLEPLTEIRGMA